jgi:hypothetical protein
MSGEDAAWRDLVARFDLPASAGETGRPWPEREDLPPARHSDPRRPPDSPPAEPSGGAGAGGGADSRDDRPGRPGGGWDSLLADGLTAIEEPGRPGPGPMGPAGPAGPVTGPGGRRRVIRPAAPAPRAELSPGSLADGDDEHFIPPPPPPLPRLDPVAKGAWTALFGGPAFLLVSTSVGWTVPGWLTFAAVAAFIGGFAVIVTRMGDGPRDDGPGDGAVL